MSGQTSKLVAQDKAEPSRLKQELKRCKNELVTQKELLIGSVNRSKKNLRDFHYLEENGLSTRKLGFQIEDQASNRLNSFLKRLMVIQTADESTI